MHKRPAIALPSHFDGAYTGSAPNASSYSMHPSSESVPYSEQFVAPFSLASMQRDLDLNVLAYQDFVD